MRTEIDVTSCGTALTYEIAENHFQPLFGVYLVYCIATVVLSFLHPKVNGSTAFVLELHNITQAWAPQMTV
jgi:hypothetical protein